MIKSGGENVYAAEVEGVLLRHPGVAAAAVVGLPDARLGEKVATAVVLRAGWSCPDYELSRVLPQIILKPNGRKGTKQLQIGCLLPLGPDSAPEDLSVAKAVLEAIKMAINEELPRLLPDRYVNMTCYDSGCDGLAAAAGVYFFADHDI
eukprot:gene3282-3559_t